MPHRKRAGVWLGVGQKRGTPWRFYYSLRENEYEEVWTIYRGVRHGRVHGRIGLGGERGTEGSSLQSQHYRGGESQECQNEVVQ